MRKDPKVSIRQECQASWYATFVKLAMPKIIRMLFLAPECAHCKSKSDCIWRSSLRIETQANQVTTKLNAVVVQLFIDFLNRYGQMNQIVKTHRIESTVCNMLFVLLFAAFVDTTSSRFESVHLL